MLIHVTLSPEIKNTMNIQWTSERLIVLLLKVLQQLNGNWPERQQQPHRWLVLQWRHSSGFGTRPLCWCLLAQPSWPVRDWGGGQSDDLPWTRRRTWRTSEKGDHFLSVTLVERFLIISAGLWTSNRATHGQIHCCVQTQCSLFRGERLSGSHDVIRVPSASIWLADKVCRVLAAKGSVIGLANWQEVRSQTSCDKLTCVDKDVRSKQAKDIHAYRETQCRWFTFGCKSKHSEAARCYMLHSHRVRQLQENIPINTAFRSFYVPVS